MSCFNTSTANEFTKVAMNENCPESELRPALENAHNDFLGMLDRGTVDFADWPEYAAGRIQHIINNYATRPISVVRVAIMLSNSSGAASGTVSEWLHGLLVGLQSYGVTTCNLEPVRG